MKVEKKKNATRICMWAEKNTIDHDDDDSYIKIVSWNKYIRMSKKHIKYLEDSFSFWFIIDELVSCQQLNSVVWHLFPLNLLFAYSHIST